MPKPSLVVPVMMKLLAGHISMEAMVMISYPPLKQVHGTKSGSILMPVNTTSTVILSKVKISSLRKYLVVPVTILLAVAGFP